MRLWPVLCILVTIEPTIIVRDNVLFKKVDDVYTSQAYWKLTLVEDLDTYSPLIKTVGTQLSQLENISIGS